MIREGYLTLLPIKIGTDYDIVLTPSADFDLTGVTCKSSLIDKISPTENAVICDFTTIVDSNNRQILLNLPRQLTALLSPKMYYGDILFIKDDKVKSYIEFDAPTKLGRTQYE